jgi:hypothetical protein
MAMQILSCALASAGALLFLWCLIGAFLLPVAGQDFTVLLRAEGGAEKLEQTLRGFEWLRGTGLIDMTLQIVDCGLNAEGLETVRRLAERRPYIRLVPDETSGQAKREE